MANQYDPARLTTLRQAAGLTLDDVAARLSQFGKFWHRFETGRSIPVPSVLEEFAHLIGVAPSELYDADDPDDLVVRFASELRMTSEEFRSYAPEKQAHLNDLLRDIGK